MDEARVEHLIETLVDHESIHVLGAGLKPDRPAHRLVHDLDQRGWRLVPIHPNDAGGAILGRPIRASLEAADPASVVVFFLSPQRTMMALIRMIASVPREDMPMVWLQPGATDEDVLALLEEGGYDAVTETCIVRFIEAHDLQARGGMKPQPWFHQVLSSTTQCSVWTVHEGTDTMANEGEDEHEWCGDARDLERSSHLVPRYIRSLRHDKETFEALGQRLAQP